MKRVLPEGLPKAISALALAAVLSAPLSASALQDSTPVTQEAPSFLGDVMGNAGLIGWLIIALSVLALARIIEHFMSIKMEKLAPPNLVDELEALLEEEKWQEAVELCDAESTYLTDIVGAGLSRLGHHFSVVESSFDEMHEEKDVQLHQKVGWLSLIAAVSPMMGLLGTVNGMVMAFGEIALKPSVKPNDLAAGIKAALVTTLLGLTVAIPVTTAFVYFKNRVVMMSIEIGAIVEDMFERFREKPTEG
ncbi:MAG: MotA/TolQ/ExbB proton channel family protein [Planctomycetota bacterium]